MARRDCRTGAVTAPAFVLVHSPLVGPRTWTGVAEVLRDRGHRVYVPSLLDALDGPPPYYPAFARAATAPVDATGGSVVLVAHSGAGALLPSVADALRVPVAAAVFVDALLPHPGLSWFSSAPPELAGLLRDLRDGDLLPPWHEWFPPGAVASLLPDDRLREAFVAELRPLPFAYFEEPAPRPGSWPPAVCCYLGLSEAYDGAVAEATSSGWRVDHLRSDHLAPVTAPAALADRLLGLTRDA